jgi:hypothetical protein
LKLLKSVFPLLLISFFGIFTSEKALANYHQISIDSFDSLTRKLNDPLPPDSIQLSVKKKKIQSKIKYSAKDSIVHNVINNEVYLYNGAEVYYEDVVLKAAFIKIDQKNKVVYANGVEDSTGQIKGKPVFTEGQQTYDAQELSYNFETKKGKIKEVITNEGEGYLHAKEVKKNELDEVFIKNGKYTTCNQEHPHFYIALTKAKNTADKTVSGPAYLVIEDVPLPLAVPFGFFPRLKGSSSGVVIPEIGEDRALGFFLRNGGYYFAVNEKVDLSIKGDIYSKGSYGMSSAVRYNNRYKYNGSLATGFTNRKIGEVNTAEYSLSQDFYIRWTHNQDPKAIPGSRFSAAVNIASRNNFRNNITPNIQSIIQNNLSSSVSYSKVWEGTPFSMSSSLTHSQNLQTGQVSLGLPRLNFSMSRINPFDSKNRVGPQKWYHKIGMNYTLDVENRIDTYDSLLFKSMSSNQMQNGLRHSLPISTSFNVLKYFTWSPYLNYNERWYFNSIEKSWNGTKVITDTVDGFKQARDYSLGFALSTRVYGLFNVQAFGISAIRHVLTPVISFAYRPDFSDANFGYYKTVQTDTSGKLTPYSIFQNGIYGSPGAGKSSLLTFSLDNNLEMKTKKVVDTGLVEKKVKLFESLRLTGNYNLAADSLKLSVLSVVARTLLFEKVNIDFNAAYDLYAMQADKFGNYRRINQLQYKNDKQLARLVSATVSLSANLNPSAFKNPNTNEQSVKVKNQLDRIDNDILRRNTVYYVDWTIPWNIAINYLLSYSKPLNTAYTSNALNVNGDLSLTKKWKIGFSSGYDFSAKAVTLTSLNIVRDLHCWDLTVNWIPFGEYQRYSVLLKVRSSVLQDLKLTKRREFYERD